MLIYPWKQINEMTRAYNSSYKVMIMITVFIKKNLTIELFQLYLWYEQTYLTIRDANSTRLA